jgi:predicted CoA-binding protein
MVDFINKKFSYAVIGASNNEEKYGYKVFKDLLESGYKVIPINPYETLIDEVTVYSSLTNYYLETKKKIDVVITVVPPKITESIIEESKKLGINKVWMQPGSESVEAIDLCIKNNIDFISGSCIMIEKN